MTFWGTLSTNNILSLLCDYIPTHSGRFLQEGRNSTTLNCFVCSKGQGKILTNIADDISNSIKKAKAITWALCSDVASLWVTTLLQSTTVTVRLCEHSPQRIVQIRAGDIITIESTTLLCYEMLVLEKSQFAELSWASPLVSSELDYIIGRLL